MTATSSTGLSAITIDQRFLKLTTRLLLLTCVASPVSAAEAPIPDITGDLSIELVSPAAEAPYQVGRETQAQLRWLDPTVFTQISPLNVPDVALKLPADQEE